LYPTLESCIETVARREYRRALGELLAPQEPDPGLVEKTEMLRLFLQAADFRRLREESERHLGEGRSVRFVLRRKRETVEHEMVVC